MKNKIELNNYNNLFFIIITIPNMDCKEPKTRKELKGNKKDKEGKGVYNQKYIRLQEALMEKNKHKDKNLKGNKDNNKK